MPNWRTCEHCGSQNTVVCDDDGEPDRNGDVLYRRDCKHSERMV